MVSVYLKAKTYDELMVRQEMMNKLSGREFQFNNSFFGKGDFYVTFKCDIATWKRVTDIINKRLVDIKKAAKKDG